MEAIKSNSDLIEKYGEPMSRLSYRGCEVCFWDDDYGQQAFTVWDGEEIGFGTYNFAYEDDMKYIIDSELDTIADGYGWRLEWFDNGVNGNRDIRLIVRTRVAKVWLTDGEVDAAKLAEDAKAIAEALIAKDDAERKAAR